MRYEERIRVERNWGAYAICGYLREFYFREQEIVKGRCVLTGFDCRRNLPMNMEDCDVYQEWLKIVMER